MNQKEDFFNDHVLVIFILLLYNTEWNVTQKKNNERLEKISYTNYNRIQYNKKG